jgi:hypothetical protein
VRIEGPASPATGKYSLSLGGFGTFAIDANGVQNGRFVVQENGYIGIGYTNPDTNLSVNGGADKPGGGFWGSYSDARLKTLHGNFNSGLRQILKLHPVRYRYKQNNAMDIRDHEEHIGLVAQDVEKVIPEAVSENNKGYLVLNDEPIIWAMLNAIREQQAQLGAQQSLIRKQQRAIARLNLKVSLLDAALRVNNDAPHTVISKIVKSGSATLP